MSEKEYIERGALIEMCKRQIECEWNTLASPGTWAHAFEDFSDLVEQTPAADVVEVRHGEWVAKDLIVRSPFARNHYCSVCQYEPIETKSYCPECGAKMGERKDIP